MNQMKTPYSDFWAGSFCYFTRKGYIRTGNILNLYWYFFESKFSNQYSDKFKFRFFYPILSEYFKSWNKLLYECVFRSGVKVKGYPTWLIGYKYIKAAYPQFGLSKNNVKKFVNFHSKVINPCLKIFNNYNSDSFEKICQKIISSLKF